jgi:hypothetical protein
MQLLPGKSIFSPPKPKAVTPPPAAQPVERDDPAVTDAREKLRQSELKRRGRAATILTGQLDDELLLGRPAAGGGGGNLG